jgi:hypothetical protein
MVAEPSAMAVTKPLLTVATFEFEDDQVTEVLALLGVTLTVNWRVPPSDIEAEDGLKLMEVGVVCEAEQMPWVAVF